MKILNGERGSGKTTKAIECAYYTNSLLIVPNRQTTGYIQEKADSHLKEKFGAEPGTVTVMSIYDIIHGRFRGLSGIKGVVIDELDWVANAILEQFGLPEKVYLATRTGEDLKCDAPVVQNTHTCDMGAFSICGKIFSSKESFEWLAEAVKEKLKKELMTACCR